VEDARWNQSTLARTCSAAVYQPSLAAASAGTAATIRLRSEHNCALAADVKNMKVRRAYPEHPTQPPESTSSSIAA
jgi:hypothetical protein